MTGLFEVILLVVALLLVMTWTCLHVLAPTSLSVKLTSRHRALRARMWLYAPLWMPLFLTGSAILSRWALSTFGWSDHCISHTHHHQHLCLSHPPHLSNHPLVWSVSIAVLLPALLLVCRAIWSVFSQLKLTRALIRSSRDSELGCDVRVLDQDSSIAITVGFIRPVILLSQGLLARVSQETLNVILAHERAHVVRHDTAWSLVDTVIASLLPPHLRVALLRELELSREQACDGWAARSEGRLQVARALVAVTRLELSRPAVGMSIGSSSLEARVISLLEPPVKRWWWPLEPLLILSVLGLIGAGPLHSIIESMIATTLH